MTPLYLVLAMPAVQVLGAGLVASRISWRKHPALIFWLGAESFLQGMGLSGMPNPLWIFPLRMALIEAVDLEIRVFSRDSVTRRRAALVFAGKVSLAALLAAASPLLTATQRFYLFRSYYLLFTAAALAVLAIWRVFRPVSECRRHQVYRTGAAMWLAWLAFAGIFVRGGLGYRLFSYTRHTWQLVNLASYWGLILTVSVMALAMALSAKSRKCGVVALRRAEVCADRRIAA